MSRGKAASPVVGRVVLKLGEDVSTDAIYPGRYMATVLPSETPQFAFADCKEFNSQLRNRQIPPGSMVVAGSNFGCGSSREQAASALRGYDLVIIARGFARIFLQNAVNLGLRIFICPDLEADEGDELTIRADRVVNHTKRRYFRLQSLPAASGAVIEAGGLIAYTRKRLLKNSGNE